MYLYFVTGTVKGDGSLSNGKYIVSNNVNNTQYILLAQCKKISIQSCLHSTKARNGPLSTNAQSGEPFTKAHSGPLSTRAHNAQLLTKHTHCLLQNESTVV
jgi:hypothetical protein